MFSNGIWPRLSNSPFFNNRRDSTVAEAAAAAATAFARVFASTFGSPLVFVRNWANGPKPVPSDPESLVRLLDDVVLMILEGSEGLASCIAGRLCKLA
jgi:hypothetical protein